MQRAASDHAAAPVGAALPSTDVIAPLWLEVAGDRRVVVRPGSVNDRLVELMDALVDAGLMPSAPADAQAHIQVDEHRWSPDTTLPAAGLRVGSRVGWAGRVPAIDDESDSSEASAVVELRVVAGPDAGHCWPLRPGSHVVGSAASATLQVADPSVEPHHLCVDVSERGVIIAVQLSGHLPIRCGTDPLPTAPLPLGAVLHLSNTSLAIGAPAEMTGSTANPAATVSHDSCTEPARSSRDPWRVPRRRVACPVPALPDPVIIPDIDPDAGAVARSRPTAPIAPALVSLGLSVVMAAVLGRPEVVWFGGLAASMGMVVWAHQRIRDLRVGRRARHLDEVRWSTVGAELVRAHESAIVARWRCHPELPELLRRAVRGDDRMWRRRDNPGNGAHTWAVVLGRGDVPWHPPAVDRQGRLIGELELVARPVGVCRNHLPGVPVTLHLTAGSVVGVTGPHGDGLVRSLLVQLAVEVGPADWQLLVVTPDRETLAAWRWCQWLPHASSPFESVLTVAELPEVVAGLTADTRQLVVVVTDPALVAHRTGPVRRLLGAKQRSVAVIVLDPEGGTAAAGGVNLPPWTTSRVLIGSAGSARWVAAEEPDVVFRPAALSVALARRAARAVAAYSDPEADDATAGLTASVTLAELVGPLDEGTLAMRWTADDPPPATALGMAADGLVEIDLVRDGPHALVAGTTGSGKSELLRTLVCGLALGSSPEHLSFVLVDYKGGSAFDACARLPHVAGVVTDLDEHLGARVLLGLDAELRRREQVLRAAGVTDLGELRRHDPAVRLPRLVVVVDEFATLAAELPDFLGALVAVAQRGRSLGVHLVLATQRPGGVVRDDVRANTNLRIALRVQDPTDALDVVGDPTPAAFARDRPGRAMVRLGPGELVMFQVAVVSQPRNLDTARRLHVELADRPGGAIPIATAGVPTELDHLVALVCRVAERGAQVRPVAPWLPPLPDVLTGTPDATSTGVLDDPHQQRRSTLRWNGSGHLVVVGGRHSGVSSTLVAATRVLAAQHPPTELHAYGIDARGGSLTRALSGLAHFGDVVGLNDRERLHRLLDRGTDELDRRLAESGTSSGRWPSWLLVVDGWGALRSSLDHDLDRLAQLDRLSTQGPAHGLVLAVGAERPGVVSAALTAAAECRWAHLQSDPLDAAAAGCSALPAGSPPGRLVDAASGLIGQVLAPASLPQPAGARSTGSCATPVGQLPTCVDRIATPPSQQTGRALHLPIGVGHRHLDDRSLVVASGDHVVVLGPPGSGRTNALRLLAHTWLRVHRHGKVMVLDGRGADPTAALAAATPHGPLALVVDDAELVDDSEGHLQHLLAGRRPDVVAFVAARPDALRGVYGHWTATARRSGTGIVLGPAGDLDGDLLGLTLPRVWPLCPRPGLGWLMQRGSAELVQLALAPDSAPTPFNTPSMMCTVRSQ